MKTMKKNIIFAVLILMAGVHLMAQEKNNAPKVQQITYQEFLKKVWDFEKSPNEFVYKGSVPAVIDFYADWCGPCRKVGPIMEKLAKEYEGRLLVYKVNVDKEKELAYAFQARSIPMVIFIPLKGQPLQTVGAMPESEFKKIIEENLMK